MIVYIYTFPNGKKYVGQTTQSLDRRAGKNGAGYKGQLVYNAIEKYGWDNIEKEIYKCSSVIEMNNLEKDFISAYNTTDRNFGYNLSCGGEINPMLGKRHSREARQKMSLSTIGMYSGEKNPMFGKHHSEESIKKMQMHSPNSKPVICLETKKIYGSAAEAARALGIKQGTNIQSVCNKKPHYKTAYGYHWAWLEDYENENLK